MEVYTVLHISEVRGVGGRKRTVAIGRSAWFTAAEAEGYARRSSQAHPSPQRFAVYSPSRDWLGTWQCGERLAAFVVVS